MQHVSPTKLFLIYFTLPPNCARIKEYHDTFILITKSTEEISMKHLKNKALAAALACVILSVSACAAPAAETKDTPESVIVTDTTEDTSVDDSSESSESSLDNEALPSYEKGSWTGSVYTNKTLGLTFTLPEGWMIADEDNIEKTVGGNEAVGGNEQKDDKKADKKNESPYDFMIVNAETNDNLLLLAEDVSTAMGGSGMTETDYLTTIKTNLISGQQTTYTPGEITTAEIAGQTYSKMEVAVLYNGYISLTQTYYCRKVGDHMLSFIASTKTDASQNTPAEGTENTADTQMPPANTCRYILESMTPAL